jgi:hypothetical protein
MPAGARVGRSLRAVLAPASAAAHGRDLWRARGYWPVTTKTVEINSTSEVEGIEALAPSLRAISP